MDPSVCDGLRTWGPDLIVECRESDGSTFSLDMSSGTIRVRARGRLEPSLRLRSRSDGSVLECLSWTKPGFESAKRLEVSVPGGPWTRHPPFDIGGQPDDHELIPHATLSVQHAVMGSPVGDLHYRDVFENGLLVRREGGALRKPFIAVEQSFTGFVASLDAKLPVLEAWRDAKFLCLDASLLMVIAGLYQGQELRAHLARRNAENAMLVRLAKHTNTQAWRNAFMNDGG
jgi:hypothetical protein